MNNSDKSPFTPKLWPIVTCQFFSAFNEDAIRILVCFFLIHINRGKEPALITSLCSIASWLPNIIFFGTSGVFADRFARPKIFLISKIISIFAALMAVLSFYFNNTIGALLSLFLFFTHSAFLTPAKYSMIPDLFSQGNVARVNSLLSSVNTIACVLGQPIAALLVELTNKNFTLCCVICCVIAVLDTSISALLLGMGKKAPVEKKEFTINPLSNAKNTIKTLINCPEIKRTLYAYIFFYFASGSLRTNVLPYAMTELGLDATKSVFLLVFSGLGLVTGAIISGAILEKISHQRIVTLTMSGTSMLFFLLYLAPSFYYVFPMLMTFGIMMGLFFVSAHSFVQLHSDKRSTGKIFSAVHFFGLLGSLVASGIILGCGEALKIKSKNIFCILSLCMTTFSFIFTRNLSGHTRH